MVCRETGAVLELFHAVNVSRLDQLRRLVPGIPNGLEQRAVETRREEVTQLRQRLASVYGLPIKVQVGVGPAFPQIETCAIDLSADLIVLGRTAPVPSSWCGGPPRPRWPSGASGGSWAKTSFAVGFSGSSGEIFS